MLEAFITNLGRYNEGYLDGAYLKLPAEKEDVQALLRTVFGTRKSSSQITRPMFRACTTAWVSMRASTS